MTSRTALRLSVILVASLLSACSNSNSSVTGKGSVRGIHAIPELGTVSFLIEETVLSGLNYKESSGTSEYDNLNYDFSFDIFLPGDSESTRLVTRNLSVDSELFQGAARFQSLDIYLVAQDVDISLIGASFPSTLFGTGTAYTSREAKTYNLVITTPGTKNIIGGPFRLDLETGRNYGIVVVDAPDITATDILFFDQTP